MSLPQSLVQEVTRRSTAELSGQLAIRAASMDAAELRGYVGAHAHGALRTHAVDILKNDGADAARVDELIDASLARTVHLVASALQNLPIIAIAPPHVAEATELVSLPMRVAGAAHLSHRAAA